jgi:hypothetical protein
MSDYVVNLTQTSNTGTVIMPQYTTGTQVITSDVSWIYYTGPSDPSEPPCGVREPRRPLVPSGSASEALALPEG